MADTPSPHEILNTIRSIHGDAAAVLLIEKRGGRRFSIPRHKSDVLCRELGPEITETLIEYFGGTEVSVPTRFHTDAESRRQQVLNSRESVNTLAQQTGLSYRRVQQIRAEAVGDDRQKDLFHED